MANRVLKRPMFRMGGSPQYEFQEKTSGILSGMDGPKIWQRRAPRRRPRFRRRSREDRRFDPWGD